MPKPHVVRRALVRRERPRATELLTLLEGQVAELCRDLALAAKRMQQLHEQAGELRTGIREWVARSEAERPGTVSRAGRR